MKYEIFTQPDFTVKEMAALIDHSLLMPYTSQKEMDAFLDEIKRYGFKVACVNNSYVEYAAKVLAGTGASVTCTVAFPFGQLAPEVKAREVEDTIKRGAAAVDVVMNIGAAKSGDWDLLYKDMSLCAEAAHKQNVSIKSILEVCYLTDAEIVKACQTAIKAGMDFVKTSTGYGTNTALLGNVKLMKDTVGTDMGVKASGPIGNYYTARAMLYAGAQRLGYRAGVDILRGCPDWQE